MSSKTRQTGSLVVEDGVRKILLQGEPEEEYCMWKEAETIAELGSLNNNQRSPSVSNSLKLRTFWQKLPDGKHCFLLETQRVA